MLFLSRLIFFLVSFTLFLFCLSCSKKSPSNSELDELLTKLNAIPDIEITEITPQHDYCQREFQIDIIQPLDHNNSGGGTFKQRMYLSHVDEELPMVFFPSG